MPGRLRDLNNLIVVAIPIIGSVVSDDCGSGRLATIQDIDLDCYGYGGGEQSCFTFPLKTWLLVPHKTVLCHLLRYLIISINKTQSKTLHIGKSYIQCTCKNTDNAN